MRNTRVMIAGIGGASLGTEIAKSLRLAGRYDVFGCDISSTAFGHYSSDFVETFHISRNDYIAGVINVCRSSECRWLIPGGEQPMTLLGASADRLLAEGIDLVGNSPDVIQAFSDKKVAFDRLRNLGIVVPRTSPADTDESIAGVGFPCIVKPAIGSGGSTFVFLATNMDEARIYVHFILRNGHEPLVQEYVDAEDGEFTVGVLSLPDTSVVGSIALRRSLDAKLSVAYRGRGGIISSGYSQGMISDFPEVRETAQEIAKAIGSRGPINVQGRMRNGRFVPFEINPRFSASTYLRAIAGFNEIDLFLGFLVTGQMPVLSPIQPGWYLRGLSETFVPLGSLK